MAAPEKLCLDTFIDDTQGYAEARSMEQHSRFPARPLISEAIIGSSALASLLTNSDGSSSTHIIQGAIAAGALTNEYAGRLVYTYHARKYIRTLNTKYPFEVVEDPELPRGVAITGPLEYDWPPESYGGIERDLMAVVEGFSDEGIPTFVFGPKTSEAIRDVKHAHLIPVIDRPFSEQDLSFKQRIAKERAIAKRIANAIHYLIDVGAVESIENRWENAEFVDSLHRTSQPMHCGIHNVFSCHPNEEIIKIMSQQWYGDKTVNSALSHAHYGIISLRQLIDETRLSLSPPDSSYGPLGVMPYGVSFHQAPLPKSECLTQTQERPNIPLLQELQAQGLDYVVQIAGISPAKSQATAIQAFKGALELGLENTVLILAGVPSKTEPKSVAYFEQEVLPHVDNHKIFYFGSADEQQKWELFGHAKASLFTSGIEVNYTEAFGRVIAESMGMGAPVVGIKTRVFRELNTPDVTGLGFATTAEASQALLRVGELNRTACAALARDRFDVQHMVDWSVRLHTNLARIVRRSRAIEIERFY